MGLGLQNAWQKIRTPASKAEAERKRQQRMHDAAVNRERRRMAAAEEARKQRKQRIEEVRRIRAEAQAKGPLYDHTPEARAKAKALAKRLIGGV